MPSPTPLRLDCPAPLSVSTAVSLLQVKAKFKKEERERPLLVARALSSDTALPIGGSLCVGVVCICPSCLSYDCNLAICASPAWLCSCCPVRVTTPRVPEDITCFEAAVGAPLALVPLTLTPSNLEPTLAGEGVVAPPVPALSGDHQPEAAANEGSVPGVSVGSGRDLAVGIDKNGRKGKRGSSTSAGQTVHDGLFARERGAMLEVVEEVVEQDDEDGVQGLHAGSASTSTRRKRKGPAGGGGN